MRMKTFNAMTSAALLAASLACGVDHGAQASAPAGTPLGPEVASDANPRAGYAVAVDVDGSPIVAYVAGGSVLAKKWTGAAWTQMGNALNDPSATPLSLAIAVEADGPTVAWEEQASNTFLVHVSHYGAQTWSARAAQLNDASSPGHGPRLVATGQGLLAAYYGGSPYNQAVVKRWTGTGWQAFPSTPSLSAAGVAIAALADGSPVLSWIYPVSQASGFQWTVGSRAWSAAAAGWTSLPDVKLSSSIDPHLLVDPAGAIDLIADDRSGTTTDVLHTVAGDSAWTSLGRPDRALSLNGPIVLDPSQRLVVAYSAGSQGAIARREAGGWADVASVPAPGFAMGSAADGSIYAVWTDLGNTAPAQPLRAAVWK
ncbi:MAG TPA: hypothetical protein VI356_06895 [Myxococcales bacterium]